MRMAAFRRTSTPGKDWLRAAASRWSSKRATSSTSTVPAKWPARPWTGSEHRARELRLRVELDALDQLAEQLRLQAQGHPPLAQALRQAHDELGRRHRVLVVQ